MKKLVFVFPSFSGGGSEKVALALLDFLKNKHRIHVISTNKKGRYFNELPPEISKECLHIKHIKFSFFKLLKAIKRQSPDIVVFFNIGNIGLWGGLLSLFLRTPKFVCRESTITSIKCNQSTFPSLVKSLYQFAFSKYNLIIAQSEYIKKDLCTNFKVPAEKIKTINNPVNFTGIKHLSNEAMPQKFSSKYKIVAVGRIVSIKRFHLLLEALVLLEHWDIQLIIVGKDKKSEPDYFRDFKKRITDKKLNNKVNLVGFQKNPYPYIKQADVLVLSSQYEGFPNVALEALAIGKPVVSFDVPGGISEIIKNDKNGYLVENDNIIAFANAIKKALTAAWDHTSIAQNAFGKYDHKRILSAYEEHLLDESFF